MQIKEVEYYFTFLDILKKYIDIEMYNNILNSIDFYFYKYLYNITIDKWKYIHKNMSKNKNFIESKYYNMKYKYIHKIISPIELNTIINEFIQDDIFEALIVIKSIDDIF